MRVLVVGEGKNDVGYQGPDGWRDGVLPVTRAKASPPRRRRRDRSETVEGSAS